MAILIGDFGSLITRRFAVLVGFAVVAILTAPLAMAEITVTLQSADGAALTSDGFRYLVEEDPTVQITPPLPGAPDTSPVLAFQFHASHAPVIHSNESLTNSVIISDQKLCGVAVCPADAGPFFITVTPFNDYALSAGQASNGDSITLTVNKMPLPTAQISVLIFRDDILNGAPDLPQEIPGTATNSFDPTRFSVTVEEPGGKYGIPGGAVLLEAFGNPLGTTYRKNPDGSPVLVDGAPVVSVLGDGVLTPGPNGVVNIKNLVPGKYGIIVVPPEGEDWIQTSTIEGSKVIDAWVASDEPPFFVEFGPPGHHVFIGYTQPKHPVNRPNWKHSISGTIRNNHMSRPPNFAFYTGNPFPDCWVALLPGQGGAVSTATHVQPCAEDSSFLIEDVRRGLHTLVVFDGQLNVVIAQLAVNITPPAGNLQTNVNLKDVPVFNWFGRLDASIFFDANENGKRDEGEPPLNADKSAVNIRFRDGTVYQSFPIDTEGSAPFDTVFPFFHWLVPEVDFVSLKATGATYWVDGGGPVDLSVGSTSPGEDVFNPQAVDAAELPCETAPPYNLETCTNDDGSRTLRGPVLTLGMQTFLGQTNKIEYGKTTYQGQENGGISGIVFYAVTRAENDPRLAAAEEWEPGVPRVQVNLYQSDGTKFQSDGTTLKTICGSTIPSGYRADLDGDLCISEPDIDVYPLEDFPGPGDTDRNGNKTFDYGDAVQVTYTDSWDDNQPTNCQGDNGFTVVPEGMDAADLAGANSACFDGMRNFNQIREAVFDGGYAFDSYLDRDPITGALTGATVDGLPTNIYVVETVTPPGYTLLREEDRNVDFGDEYVPATFAKTGPSNIAAREALGDLPFTLDPDLDLGAPAACVGVEHLVQNELSYLTHADGSLLPNVEAYSVNPDNEAPYRGEMRRECDQKVVTLTPGKNTAADFFVFTQTPISANVVGGILNDLGNEFDLNSPNFGEKFAPPYLPVGFYDWNGNQILRTHGDRFGKYNGRLPSTVTINVPMPSGVSPYMATACMNDAAKVDDGTGTLVRDPNFDSRYSQFCYTFQYMPGSTTYLDTPVLPISAFATTQQFPLDCEIPQGMPGIYSVNVADKGPVLNERDGGTVTITSAGLRRVRNPNYDGTNDQFIYRDNGFGTAKGRVTLKRDGVAAINYSGNRISSWNNDAITFDIPAQTLARGDYQLTIRTAGNASTGLVTPVGVTFTVLGNGAYGNRLLTVGPAGAYSTIQAAIDASESGDLITVAPGEYDELVILYRSVQLQGWGAYGTVINATKFPARKLRDWRQKINGLFDTNQFTPLPHQENGFNQANNEPDGFFKEEGAAITVVAAKGNGGNNKWKKGADPRIDGFGITGASHGGGVFINGFVKNLMVSNNHVFANQGTFGGGIRAGDSFGLPERGNGQGADNDDLNIHHNQIAQNGANGGSGAGISLYTGADDYRVTQNWVCGNFSSGDGGGIGHKGLSTGGFISDNLISFNQSFSQGRSVHGGGISIAGIQLLDALGAPQLSEGSGDVRIRKNAIVGNHAGAGDGGGIRLQFIDGENEDANRIVIAQNVIANNVAGMTGAGISLLDTRRTTITRNTITNNDSTATAGRAFVAGDPNMSQRQTGAGIVSYAFSDTLRDELGVGPNRFSNPNLNRNIIWHNRVFNWVTDIDLNTGEDCFYLEPFLGSTSLPPGCSVSPATSAAVYSDLAVLGTDQPRFLNPRRGILTDFTGYDPSNSNVAPVFTLDVPNGEAGQGIQQQELTTAIAAQPALDEGGNFIDLRYGPISIAASGNYNETAVNGSGQLVGADNVGANSSRWHTGFKLAAGTGRSAATTSGVINVSLPGISGTDASGFGGMNAEDDEVEEDEAAEDAVKSITLDLGDISIDAIGQNVTNEQSN